MNVRTCTVARALAVASAVTVLLAAASWLVWRGRVKLERPAPTLLFEDVRGRYLAEISRDQRRHGYWPLPDEIPPRVLAATLAAEDTRFYEHNGIDYQAVGRAVLQNLEHHRIVSGASTIAMQVARIQHPAPRTFSTKLVEAVTARLLVRRYGHAAVLRHYLTIAPYGNQNYGVAYAARVYFAKPPQDLTWAEATLLASLPCLPGRMNLYQPSGWQRAIARTRHVLGRLNDLGQVSDPEYMDAIRQLPYLRPARRDARPETCLHAILRIERELRSQPQRWAGLASYRIRTSIDLDLQDEVRYQGVQAMRELRPDGAGNVAVVVADRRSGEIRAYLGSDDFFDRTNKGAIDYASVPRSSGSTLKPFIYALGMEVRGYTAATLLTDVGIPLDGRTGAYVFRNYDESYLGPILYRNALANSRNIPAVQVLQAVGLDTAYRRFIDLGLVHTRTDPAQYGLGLAIGGLYVTLYDLVRAYGVLANDGRAFDLRWYPEPGVAERRTPVLPPDIARAVTLFLSDPMARLPSFPRMGPLEYAFPVAVKTGTSKGFRDAWCVAYSDSCIVGVWIGHPDNYPMKRRAGADSAAVLAHRIMEILHPGQSDGLADVSFPPPPSWISRRISMLTGKLATNDTQHVALEWFRPGTEPVVADDSYRAVRIDTRTGQPATPATPPQSVRRRTYVVLDPRFAAWARESGLELAPLQPAAAPRLSRSPVLRVSEPPDGIRLRRDPEMPNDYCTIALEATASPPSQQLIWYVDGRPYQITDYPYATRWTLSPGTHTFQVRLLSAPVVSPVNRVTVVD